MLLSTDAILVINTNWLFVVGFNTIHLSYFKLNV